MGNVCLPDNSNNNQIVKRSREVGGRLGQPNNFVIANPSLPISQNTTVTLELEPDVTGLDSIDINFYFDTVNQRYQFTTCNYHFTGDPMAYSGNLTPTAGTWVDYSFETDTFYEVGTYTYTISSVNWNYLFHLNLCFPGTGNYVQIFMYAWRFNQSTGKIDTNAVGYENNFVAC